MTAWPVPKQNWKNYGSAPLPTGAYALDEPFSAFPSWFMCITCERCGKDRMLNEAHTAQRDLPIRAVIDRMRHDCCGGRAGWVELLTGIEGASNWPVRKITLIGKSLRNPSRNFLSTKSAVIDPRSGSK